MKTLQFKLAALAFVAGIATTAATLAAVTAPAYAADTRTLERAVFHRDLDLSTPAGRRALDARIRRIATRFCVPPSEATPAVRLARRDCVAAVIASADAQVERQVARDVAARSATRSAAIQP